MSPSASQTRAEKRRVARAEKKRRSKFLKNAVQFAERNISIFPIAEDGKVPLTKKGFHNATTDSGQIKKWAKEHPNANIGIPTGQASRFIVIDLDRKGGVDGVQAFNALCDELDLELPDTYKAKTPNGGRHLFFRTKHAGLIRNSAGVLGPGIDIRGEGGYVVGEGSVIDGKRYRCIGGSLDDIATLPKKLHREIKNAAKRRRRGNGHGDDIPEGQRNELLFREACAFRAAGYNRSKVLDLIERRNLTSCNPPLPHKEIETIVESAFTYETPPSRIESPETALTDMGNARRFALANDGRIKYVNEHGKYIFREEGQHWRFDEGMEYALAKKSALDLLKEVPEIDNLETQKAVSKHGLRSESKVSIEACLKLVQSEPEISASIHQFDKDQWALPAQDSVIDLRTGLSRPITAEDYFLKILPVAYNANAECPNWLSFLEFVQPNRSMRRYLQKLAGLTLVGSAAQEIIIFLYGGAGTGKSTFIKTVMKVFGRELAIKFPTAVLLARRWDGPANELLPFFGARMAVATEVPGNRRFNEAVVKDLASNDMLTTRPLYREAIQFAPTHTLWLYGNHLPSVDGADPGIERRLCLLPFKRVIPEYTMDKNFDEKLEPELPGILNWMIDGCLAWQAGGIKKPRKVRVATDVYLSDNDLIKLFIKERLVVDLIGEEESATALYTAYKEWAQDRGDFPVSITKFGTALVERGLLRIRRDRGNYYIGVSVIEQGDR